KVKRLEPIGIQDSSRLRFFIISTVYLTGSCSRLIKMDSYLAYLRLVFIKKFDQNPPKFPCLKG
ncbi:hypothetical protein, partial [Bacillus paramycoides]|uniref:hypothetical protein n=1 Tax=Bacillus paramycoides TaxID=2026194 RepID=UPI003CFC11B3